MAKEHVNPSVDWKNPLNFPHQHAERYKDQLKHVTELDPDAGYIGSEVPTKLPSLTPQETRTLVTRARFIHRRNIFNILEQNGIKVTRKEF